MTERRFPMAMRVLTFLALLALSACGGSNQAAGESPSPTAPAQVTPSASANLDPCQLVTQQEASQLAGTTYAAGKKESISSASSMCTYGAQTLNVFTVEVAV